MRLSTLSLLALALVSAASAAWAGGPPSLVGTWEGSFSCKAQTPEGKSSAKESDSTLQIAQTGNVLRVLLDGDTYSGTIFQSVGAPNEGAGAWIFCGTSDSTTAAAFNEIETIQFKVDPESGSGSIKKSGVYVLNGSQVGVCKGSWRRVSTEPPVVGTCD